jgi:hypothetical protein
MGVSAERCGTGYLFAGAIVVLAGSTLSRILSGRWPPIGLLAVAFVILSISPGKRLLGPGQSIPLGLWVIAGSFALFAVGTMLALTRSKWHSAVAATPAPSDDR